MGNIAIEAENLSKAYQLGEIGTGTISRDLERWYARIRGKQDPFLRIGESNNRSKKGNSDVVWSLKDINFEIEQGDAVGIIGRNGAGKSTLLKILSRVTSPTTGRITGKGRIASLLEVGTGFHPELTGRENIFLNGAIQGMRKHEIKHKFDEIVDFAGVERYIDTPVKRYSSGMYVRLAFAVAAHLESEILIVDEVLAVGDAEFQKKCLGKMGEVSKGEGRTVLFVSHNMDSISSLCNKGVVLLNGQMLFQGTTIEAIQKYIKTNNKITSQEVDNYRLNEKVIISKFKVDKESIESLEDLEFELSILCDEINIYHTVALLLYNELNEKVAFIDLRMDVLSDKSLTNPTLSISGQLKSLPLIPGQYNLGIHIHSTLVYKDFFNIIHFTIKQKAPLSDLQPYPLSVRGKVELDYIFEYKKSSINPHELR